MLYQISRNGQMYGPYTLEDLQRYVASGNVLATDLAKADGMPDWVPVWQVLGIAAPTPPTYGAGNATYANVAQSIPGVMPPYQATGGYPSPPNLSWVLVLLFTFLTCGIFWYVWIFVQQVWLRKVQPSSNAIFFWIGLIGIGILRFFLGLQAAFHPRITRYAAVSVYVDHPVLGLLAIASIAVYCLAAFGTRSALEEHFNTVEPIGLKLSGVMTFFFSVLYFQYHFNRINEYKRAALYQSLR